MLNILALMHQGTSNQCSYYFESTNEFLSENNVYFFSNFTVETPLNVTIIDLIKQCPTKIDLIIYGLNWTNCGNRYPLQFIDWSECRIPAVIMLNKEYLCLDKKLNWVKEINPIFCTTAHHDDNLYEKQIGVKFINYPFAVNHTIFKNYNLDYKYDLGFTGVVLPNQTNNWREKIKNYIENNCKEYNIYFNSDKLQNSRLDYAKNITESKIWISTTGPADLVGPRYFEVMSTGTTLLICNRMEKVYDRLFEENKHCVMFSTVEEFKEKIDFYLKNEKERLDIVKNAQSHIHEYHTWSVRNNFLNKKILETLKEKNL